jgi:protein-disulfide isomerase
VLLVTTALVLLGGLALISTLGRGPGGSPAASGGAARAPASALPRWPGPRPPDVDPEVMLGNPAAPVTMVEFADYQCPFCGEFDRSVQPALVARYVGTGTLRIVWRDFPYYGAASEDAAVAARAAGRQHRFWAFHDALYAQRPVPGGGGLTAARFDAIARDLALDPARFDADRGDPALRGAVRADFAFGRQLGVPGTPAFLVNGSPELFGAQPLATFEQAIEQARQPSGAGPAPR